jgi:hypothetical protein
VQADAHLEQNVAQGRDRWRQPPVQLPHRGDDPESGAHCPRCVVLVSLGIAEVDEQPVTHVPGDGPPEVPNRPVGDVLIGAQNVPQLLGIEPRSELGRPDQVAEHHGDLPALSLLPGRGRG